MLRNLGLIPPASGKGGWVISPYQGVLLKQDCHHQPLAKAHFRLHLYGKSQP